MESIRRHKCKVASKIQRIMFELADVLEEYGAEDKRLGIEALTRLAAAAFKERFNDKELYVGYCSLVYDNLKYIKDEE